MSSEPTQDQDLFELALPTPGELTTLASKVAGGTMTEPVLSATPIAYDWASPVTGGLWRVDVKGMQQSVAAACTFFVKLVHHTRLWPGLMWMPEGGRADFIDFYPWRFELDMHESGIERILPPGMRAPSLYHVHEADADHYAMWCEFIHERPGRWELPDYRLAARLLGQLAARRRDGSGYDVPIPEVALRAQARGSALRYYAQKRVVLGALPHLRDSQVWAHPIIKAALSAAADRELPSDLHALGDRIPKLLDMLDALPQTYAHGDASPQNLLRPADEPETIAVIDWGFGTLLPVGFDLGQLLVGLANTGDVDPAELPAIDATIFPAYLDGMAAEGYEPDAKAVRNGYVGSLVVRSALCTLPLELLAQGPSSDDAVALFVRRMQLARRLLDMSAELDSALT